MDPATLAGPGRHLVLDPAGTAAAGHGRLSLTAEIEIETTLDDRTVLVARIPRDDTLRPALEAIRAAPEPLRVELAAPPCATTADLDWLLRDDTTFTLGLVLVADPEEIARLDSGVSM